MSSTQEFTIEKAFEQIEDIVTKLEDSSVGLEDSFKLYKEGCDILKKCNETIEQVEKKLIEI